MKLRIVKITLSKMGLIIPVNNDDHIKGREKVPVTLVEYGDFECPDCRQAYPIIKEIYKTEKDKLKIVFRNFPMAQIHPHALHAAYAAEAAAKQKKFWEMHDLLFENQDALEDHSLMFYAKTLNLDLRKFKKDMISEEVKKRVKDDFMGGVRSGVNKTPTFFINGVRFDGPSKLNSLRKAIKNIEQSA